MNKNALFLALALHCMAQAPELSPKPVIGQYGDAIVVKFEVTNDATHVAYVWYKNSQPLSYLVNGKPQSQVSDFLLIRPVAEAAGVYYAKATNPLGYTTSVPFRVATTSVTSAAALTITLKLPVPVTTTATK